MCSLFSIDNDHREHILKQHIICTQKERLDSLDINCVVNLSICR